MRELPQERFDALVVPTRGGFAGVLWRELEWWAADDGENLIGTVILDLVDKGYSWVLLGRENNGRYRAWKLNASLQDRGAARRELQEAMRRA